MCVLVYLGVAMMIMCVQVSVANKTMCTGG